MLKHLLPALALLPMAVAADVEFSWGSSPVVPPLQIESFRLRDEMARTQAQRDDAVSGWLEAALAAQTQPVKVKPVQLPGDPCHLAPDDGVRVARGWASSQAGALADAKANVPQGCKAGVAGKDMCERVADFTFGKNSEFLAEYKKFLRNPKWSYECRAVYSCPQKQRRVCGGPRGVPAAGSKQ